MKHERGAINLITIVIIIVLLIFVLLGVLILLNNTKNASKKNFLNNTDNLLVTENQIEFDTDQNVNKIDKGENNIENEIKILVERHTYWFSPPMDNGHHKGKGTSKFIASDGFIYEYEYEYEYGREDDYFYGEKYPDTENLKYLSEELISKAKKTEQKLTNEELELVEEYIRIVEEENEEIKEVKSSKEYPADINIFEKIIIYNYISGKGIQINPEINEGIYYKSPSITKLLKIVNKYF